MSTLWSVVATAADPSAPDASTALARLCELYWSPLYFYVRRRGYDSEEAQDLTQGFLARLLEKRDFAAASPERGRFRSYLLAAFQHYLANERDRASSLKRGGGFELLSLDFQEADQCYLREASHDSTPEKAYARRWVLALLDRVLDQLRQEMAASGKENLFGCLKPLLTPDGKTVPYPELAAELGLSESALKVTVHRMRRRYGELLREHVASTLDDPALIREEVQFLISAMET